LINAALANQWHGAKAWEWLSQHWQELLDRFPHNSHARMVENIALLPPETAAAVHSFLEANPVTAGHKTVEQTLERMDVNVAFRQREGERLARVFADEG
jgi:nicotinate-nucleotide pyrophosphorylase